MQSEIVKITHHLPNGEKIEVPVMFDDTSYIFTANVHGKRLESTDVQLLKSKIQTELESAENLEWKPVMLLVIPKLYDRDRVFGFAEIERFWMVEVAQKNRRFCDWDKIEQFRHNPCFRQRWEISSLPPISFVLSGSAKLSRA